MNVRRRSTTLALLIALGLWTAEAPCFAEESDSSEKAASHFDAGLSLYQQGRMRDAAVEFLTAYELAPHGDALFNAGLALDAAGDSAGAATAFAWALELGMRAEAATEAKSRLERLAPQLGTVRVTTTKKATVEISPLKRRGPKMMFYVLPGDVLVTNTSKSGALVARRLQVAAREEAELDFLPKATDDASDSEDDSEPEPEADPKPKPKAAEEAPFPWTTLGYVAIGTSVVAAGATVGLRLATLRAKDDYDASNHTDADAREQALSLNRWTNVALVTTLLTGAAGGGILLFHEDPKKDVSLAVGPGSVHVFGRF
ncbi:MAG: hypothetical protein U0263_39225 [Polyangiaceae bacterium]